MEINENRETKWAGLPGPAHQAAASRRWHANERLKGDIGAP
jgi:hypothetical protein